MANDTAVYLEERYGRNFPLTTTSFAKRTLRRRLTGVLLCDSVPECKETAKPGLARVESRTYLRRMCLCTLQWGPEYQFVGHGLSTDIDKMERILKEEVKAKPGTPPILALFTEFPSNPLLRSTNLPRLCQLADKYRFIIVIDETIGTFVKVKVIQYANIVVSSLKKVLSGASNVMGGSLVLNPQSRHYNALKVKLT
ncbi:hypothetical protein EST38_g11689 [Candolleomyces aberdarensis]|uniref:Cystathionine gamma-synthase n=1 Tax=Candolleomyces aberdarensis TaxID=2316362 RepID=A0A4Q2D6X4_9AGAR|nr:hypothetical protein EST38_g11689 [Candolleomyces aberdarensis]